MKNQIDTNILIGDAFCSTKYCQAIKILMYFLICSRPKIAFSAGRLSRFMEKPFYGLMNVR